MKNIITGRIEIGEPALSGSKKDFLRALDFELKGLREDIISAWVNKDYINDSDNGEE